MCKWVDLAKYEILYFAKTYIFDLDLAKYKTT